MKGIKRILMAVTSDLATDQRVHRSCQALTEAGYHVTLVGRVLPDSLPLSRSYKTRRFRLLFNKKAVFYAEYNFRFFLYSIFHNFDLIFANDTDTLLGCAWASHLKRRPLVVDSHELFCEVPELVGRPRVRNFWERIERRFLPKSALSITVCDSIAAELNKRYGIIPIVVRNVPINRQMPARKTAIPGSPRVLLYQGAVNIGRGVDWMIEAMEYLPQCIFVVAGGGDELEEMKHLANSKPWKDSIVFKGRLDPEELKELTVNADLGISLLENRGLNYYYSLPNRIADFVQAHVPVLATDFPEIRQVVEKFSIGTLIEGHHPKEIADSIINTLNQWDQMSAEDRSKIFNRASSDLCWENEKNHFLAAIDAIFEKQSRL